MRAREHLTSFPSRLCEGNGHTREQGRGMLGGVPDHPAWEFCPNLKTCWAERSKGGPWRVEKGRISGSCLLGLMGGSEHRRLLDRMVWETDIKAERRGSVCGTATAAVPGQSRAAEWRVRNRQGATRWHWRNTWPHSTQRPGLLRTHITLLFVCLLSATYQPGDRSRKPTTNVGGEDAGRSGQPGGEITPADG